MVSKMSSFSRIKLEIKLIVTGRRLLNLPSSTAHLLNVLKDIERVLSGVQQAPCQSINNAMQPIVEAMISKKLVKHPDVVVNISVSSCICEILRITAPESPYSKEQMKDFFELVVITFEKLSSVSSGCYTKMTKVLKLFSDFRLPVLMLDLDQVLDGLVNRLFKQFLNAADSNSSAVVHEMEKIMTMIIVEGDDLTHELRGLILTSVKNDNKTSSPVCVQLGPKVLVNCAAQLKTQVPDMSIALYDRSKVVARIGKSSSEKDIMEAEEIIPLATETVRRRAQEKITLMCDDPPFMSKSATNVKGKRKRNYTPLKKQLESPLPERVLSPQSDIKCVQGYNVKNNIAPILEAIFKKHGDIAAKCIYKIASVRTSFLEIVCEIVKRIQTDDIKTIISEVEEIECQVSEAEAANVDVSWIRAYLADIHKMKEAKENSTLLSEMKANTILVKTAARMDLKESREELIAAQVQFEKAETCVKVLDLVDKKLSDNILETEAKKDSWVKQLFL